MNSSRRVADIVFQNSAGKQKPAAAKPLATEAALRLGKIVSFNTLIPVPIKLPTPINLPTASGNYIVPANNALL
jgi:hypothetical protein